MPSRRDFLKLLAGAGGSALFVPYAKSNPRVKRVYLFETNIAGFQYHEGVKPEVAATLTPGSDLILAREPQNEHDEAAIAVYTPQGAKVGYVPRSPNAERVQELKRRQAANAEMRNRRRLKTKLWSGLYSCFRHDVVCLPAEGLYAPAKKMENFLDRRADNPM